MGSKLSLRTRYPTLKKIYIDMRVFILLCLIIYSCQSNPEASSKEKQKKEMLLGMVERDDYNVATYKGWFDSTYQAYTPDSAIIDSLKTGLDDTRIKVFLGTWCSDSRREVPALYKILDQTGFSKESLTVIGIDRDKKEPADLLDGHEIEYVPTIIVYRADEELGKIVEFPQKTLEKDLLDIIDIKPEKSQ